MEGEGGRRKEGGRVYTFDVRTHGEFMPHLHTHTHSHPYSHIPDGEERVNRVVCQQECEKTETDNLRMGMDGWMDCGIYTNVCGGCIWIGKLIYDDE